MNRRSFLSILGASYLAGHMSYGINPKKTNKMILLFLDGGIAHQPFTNAHPDAIGKYAPINGVIPTNVGGLYFGADFSNLAKMADKLRVVQSFGHNDANHDSAKHYVNTHFKHPRPAANSPSVWPSYGSAAMHAVGLTNSGMPSYVKLDSLRHNDGAFLGVKYNGYDFDQGSDLNIKVSKERFEQRLRTLEVIEKGKLDKTLGKKWTDLRDQAVEIVSGDVSKAFDLTLESEEVRNKYLVGSNQRALGNQLLMAKRLIKNGACIVSTRSTGWDNHSGVSQSFKTRGQELDYLLSTLISDLSEEGLLSNTLVVVMSEFGRTALNSNTPVGQDHWPKLCSLLMAGGGKDGSVIGRFDKNILEPTDNPIAPNDLGHTLLSWMGVDNETVYDIQNRPRVLLPEGKNILMM